MSSVPALQCGGGAGAVKMELFHNTGVCDKCKIHQSVYRLIIHYSKDGELGLANAGKIKQNFVSLCTLYRAPPGVVSLDLCSIVSKVMLG